MADVPVSPEHDASAIVNDIKILWDLASELRTRRFQNGALSHESLRLSFTLDESGIPVDCSGYERHESNQLVEEVCWSMFNAILVLTLHS